MLGAMFVCLFPVQSNRLMWNSFSKNTLSFPQILKISKPGQEVQCQSDKDKEWSCCVDHHHILEVSNAQSFNLVAFWKPTKMQHFYVIIKSLQILFGLNGIYILIGIDLELHCTDMQNHDKSSFCLVEIFDFVGWFFVISSIYFKIGLILIVIILWLNMKSKNYHFFIPSFNTKITAY